MTPEYLRLSEADIAEAARKHGLNLAALKAVIDVESTGSGFWVLPDFAQPVPVINFEHHYFSRLTNRRFDRSHPHLSSRSLDNLYGHKEWHRLSAAISLDRPAALQSASWGLMQVMGAHWKWLGYESIEELVEKCHRHERDQLELGIRFIIKRGLKASLNNQDWETFAEGYNGGGYRRHGYHLKLANRFAAQSGFR